MNVLVTGSKGFIGRNLIETLKTLQFVSNIFACDADTEETMLDKFCRETDFVFHLAGVNRPKNDEEFEKHNVGFTKTVLNLLRKHQNHAPVLVTSSIQSELDNPYGRSKKMQEALVASYGITEHVRTYIFRLPNVFGKWCRPNYNSVVATFCYNIAREIPIQITDAEKVLQLVYIDDVVNAFISKLQETDDAYTPQCSISEVYHIKLGALSALLASFKESRKTLFVPVSNDSLVQKLYATYLSYLPEAGFVYPLHSHTDVRGSFTEFLKSGTSGQISINVIKPGITKGNHWHHTKNEKFLAVSGSGEIRLRKVGDEKMIKIPISGDCLQVVDIAPGFTHSIENNGGSDLVVVIWASELYDEKNPDTFYQEV